LFCWKPAKNQVFLSCKKLSETLYFHIDNNQRHSVVAVDCSYNLKKNIKEIEV
jgi:hypothetical protein